MLKVSNLSKSFQSKPVLRNLCFEIPRGKIAIILGGSGSGKSTLLRVLNQLEDHEGGSFFLDDSILNHKQNVGMVFQQFNLFENLTTFENIVCSLVHGKNMNTIEAKQIAQSLLERYGLAEKSCLPVSRLSGGQKQRLAIARTLAVDPKIICMDEPTSALDPRLTAQVAKYITELAAENKIVIVTTHDMGLVDLLDGHLFLMENGCFVESVSKGEYRANPGMYPRLKEFIDCES